MVNDITTITTTTTTNTRIKPSIRTTIDDSEFGCDRWPLHYACRVGNIEHIHYLITVRNVNVNEYDEFDRTPLYLGALTGNIIVCQVLLEYGAKCDETIHDNARIFYVALTSELRSLLIQWNLNAQSIDPFLNIIRSSFNNQSLSSYPDCIVKFYNASIGNNIVNSECIYVHRIILQARCPTLAECIVEMNHDDNTDSEYLYELVLDRVLYSPTVTILLLNYLYTGIITNIQSIEVAIQIQHLAQMYNLSNIYNQIDNYIQKYNTQITMMSTGEGRMKKKNKYSTVTQPLEEDDDNAENFVHHNNNDDIMVNNNNNISDDNDDDDDDEINNNDENRNNRFEGDDYINILRDMYSTNDDNANEFVDNNNSLNHINDDDDENENRFQCQINETKQVKIDMYKIAQIISKPVVCITSADMNNSTTDAVSIVNKRSSNKFQGTIKIICNDSLWYVHKFIICNHSEYFASAIQGQFKEAMESQIDLSFMTTVDVIIYTIQWMYCDSFILRSDVVTEQQQDNHQKNNNKTTTNTTSLLSAIQEGSTVDNNDNNDTTTSTGSISVDVAVEILQFGYAILCPRLSQYVATTVLIPAVTVENVFNMIQLSRSLGENDDGTSTSSTRTTTTTSVDRLEEKCVTIIGENFDILEYSLELLQILINDIGTIQQRGDVTVADIPIAAEIRRALYKINHPMSNTTKKLIDQRIKLLINRAAEYKDTIVAGTKQTSKCRYK